MCLTLTNKILEIFSLISRQRILNIFLYEKEYFLYEKNIQNPMSTYNAVKWLTM